MSDVSSSKSRRKLVKTKLFLYQFFFLVKKRRILLDAIVKYFQNRSLSVISIIFFLIILKLIEKKIKLLPEKKNKKELNLNNWVKMDFFYSCTN